MHNFNRFPELTNAQMPIYYFNSPHKQITKNFFAKVDEVIDGDTIRLSTSFRDFLFPMRIINIDTPELSAPGGEESKNFLEGMIEGKEVEIIIDQENRVGKRGRLVGDVRDGGILVSEHMVRSGHALPFERRGESWFQNIGGLFNLNKWLS